jgi:uracil-DNA glycosylase family 4
MSISRDRVLNELGLGPQWRLRDVAPIAGAELSPAIEVQVEAQDDAGNSSSPPQSAPPSPVRVAPSRAAAPVVATAMPMQVDAAQLDWDGLSHAVSNCRACALCEARKQAVLGVGAARADWLFVGDGPGADEDEYGEPFVGPAGKLLDAMLAAIDIQRGENVYIANAVKCLPSSNRKPEPEEIATCRPYLQRQIELLQPKLIVALGRAAAQTLLQQEIKIGTARGQLFDYKGIPLIVTYHPAYLLSSPHDKAKAWEDLCLARRSMR